VGTVNGPNRITKIQLMLNMLDVFVYTVYTKSAKVT